MAARLFSAPTRLQQKFFNHSLIPVPKIEGLRRTRLAQYLISAYTLGYIAGESPDKFRDYFTMLTSDNRPTPLKVTDYEGSQWAKRKFCDDSVLLKQWEDEARKKHEEEEARKRTKSAGVSPGVYFVCRRNTNCLDFADRHFCHLFLLCRSNVFRWRKDSLSNRHMGHAYRVLGHHCRH